MLGVKRNGTGRLASRSPADKVLKTCIQREFLGLNIAYYIVLKFRMPAEHSDRKASQNFLDHLQKNPKTCR